MSGVPLGLPFTAPASEATMETDGPLTAGFRGEQRGEREKLKGEERDGGRK